MPQKLFARPPSYLGGFFIFAVHIVAPCGSYRANALPANPPSFAQEGFVQSLAISILYVALIDIHTGRKFCADQPT